MYLDDSALKQILQSTGMLVTAIIIVVNSLKAIGLPGKFAPFISILVGIAGAYLTLSHEPAVFIIVGVLSSVGEHGVYAITSFNATKTEAPTVTVLAPEPETEVKADHA
jgi:hypothetical protein